MTAPPNFRHIDFDAKCCLTCRHSSEGDCCELICYHIDHYFENIDEFDICDDWEAIRK
jgi:hypothetical protein